MAGIRDILIISTLRGPAQLRAPDQGRLAVRGQPLLRGAAIAGRADAGLPHRRGVHRLRVLCADPGGNIFYGNGLSRQLRRAVENAEAGALSVVTLGHDYAWLDTGTMESLLRSRRVRARRGARPGHAGGRSRGDCLGERVGGHRRFSRRCGRLWEVRLWVAPASRGRGQDRQASRSLRVRVVVGQMGSAA